MSDEKNSPGVLIALSAIVVLLLVIAVGVVVMVRRPQAPAVPVAAAPIVLSPAPTAPTPTVLIPPAPAVDPQAQQAAALDQQVDTYNGHLRKAQEADSRAGQAMGGDNALMLNQAQARYDALKRALGEYDALRANPLFAGRYSEAEAVLPVEHCPSNLPEAARLHFLERR